MAQFTRAAQLLGSCASRRCVCGQFMPGRDQAEARAGGVRRLVRVALRSAMGMVALLPAAPANAIAWKATSWREVGGFYIRAKHSHPETDFSSGSLVQEVEESPCT
mmetsp:Transcript_6171/g.17237  ORF Transcript_6171/g.17237 Transcript_6171/m.17237 type:complete len:106 (+) Transcript_6171:41-358(+)